MTPIVVVLCGLAWTGDEPQSSKTAPPTAANPADVVTSLEAVMAEAIARAEPSVVAIHRDKAEHAGETQAVRGRRSARTFREPPQFDPRFRRPMDPDDFVSFDYGSGVVVGKRGQILTAFHVVRGAARLRVRAAGHQSFEAEVLAADPRSDLAVIAPRPIPGVDPPDLKPLPVGDASRLRKGSFLIALGNPFNAARDGSPSASWGILSNRARRLDFDPEEISDGPIRRTPRLQNYPTLLQLDAKLNLGMSGGAVVNLQGELVGVTTTASSPAGFDSQAGYAIPMDRIGRRAVLTLMQGREVEYGLLGIRADLRHTNRVDEVQAGSPAALGDLQQGDEILAVDDERVTDFDSLILAINVFPPGEPIRLKIRRGEAVLDKTVVLAKFPVDGEIIATNRPHPWRGLRVDYATARNYRPVPGFPETSSGGVVVTEVEDGSPAAAAGLRKGQLIQRVDKKPVPTPRAFAEAVEGRDGPVVLDTDGGAVTVGK